MTHTSFPVREHTALLAVNGITWSFVLVAMGIYLAFFSISAFPLSADSANSTITTLHAVDFNKQLGTQTWGWSADIALAYFMPNGELGKYLDSKMGYGVGIDLSHHRVSMHLGSISCTFPVQGRFEDRTQCRISSLEIGYVFRPSTIIITPFSGISYQELSFDPVAEADINDGSGEYPGEMRYDNLSVTYGVNCDFIFSRKAFMRENKIDRMSCTLLRIKAGASNGQYGFMKYRPTDSPIYFVQTVLLVPTFANTWTQIFRRQESTKHATPKPEMPEPPIKVKKRRDLRLSAVAAGSAALFLGAGYYYNKKTSAQLDVYYAKNKPGSYDKSWNTVEEFQYSRDFCYFTGAWLASFSLISLTF